MRKCNLFYYEKSLDYVYLAKPRVALVAFSLCNDCFFTKFFYLFGIYNKTVISYTTAKQTSNNVNHS